MTESLIGLRSRFSNEQLLKFALTMLDQAAKEQLSSNRKHKWLINNSTIEAIRERVASFEKEDLT